MTEEEVRRRWFPHSGVQIHRNVPNDSMPAFYRSIDLHVNALMWGGVGRSSLEAMSTGRPVVMFSNANRYPVTEDTGYLIPPASVPHILRLAQRLQVLRAEIALRGFQARPAIEMAFTQEAVAEAMRTVLQDLLTTSKPAMGNLSAGG